ncbi:hypothetical protein [Kitasatospora kifunensis]|uniref:Uncharacterized protein n=1 Tax=Kitasatospora kifunensis TaxID=58351 RepID=A0A7W7R9T2_KITKI|nr:hypothetical protein [Kitasatospora kifunensis]MBB4928038.1 hypothetical protein [Kitasatospora kifunensis]
MDSVIEEARAFLPLTVSTTELDDDGMSIGGRNWRFRINTNWRITSMSRPSGSTPTSTLTSTAQGPPDALSSAVRNRRVVDLQLWQHDEYIDLRAVLDDHQVVEVVSDFPYGEWTFSIWREGDPEQVPVYDLSGPLQP